MKGEIWYYSDAAEKTADRPHRNTIRLGLLAPSLAVIAAIISIASLQTSQQALKVGQRAYISISEISSAFDPVALTIQCKATNMGNTPAYETVIDYSIEGTPPENFAAQYSFQSLKFDARHIAPKESTNDEVVISRNKYMMVPVENGFLLRQTVHYDDVFQDHHLLNVCWSVSEQGKATSCGTKEIVSSERALTNLAFRLRAWYYRLGH